MIAGAFDFSTIDPLHERLCLDFTNTTPFHHNLSEDHLQTYADLISWSLNVDLLDEQEALRLLDVAARQPSQAAAALHQAIVLREAIYRILSDIAGGQTPDSADLDTFNTALSAAMAHMRIAPQGSGFGWEWVGEEDHLEQMLWPVAWSAAELLLSDDRQYIRECGGHDCDWLFLDTSRNHSRRWCDMKTCGNRAKARRHYRRAKGAE
jgi:predicted RNA-binding Zn ribbon-like protein